MNSTFRKMRQGTGGFTLIEILVVVVVIAILMAGTFRLMGIASDAAKQAKTKAIMERVHNALGAFYAEYGAYPPSASYDSLATDADFSVVYTNPVEVIFIMPPTVAEEPTGDALGYVVVPPDGGNEADMKFGLVAYLIPRLSSMYGGNARDPDLPDRLRFQYKIKKALGRFQGNAWDDAVQYEGVDPRTDVCNRWKPQIADLLSPKWDDAVSANNHGEIWCRVRDISDAWDKSLMYECAPPFQHYRLISRGPNKNLDKETSPDNDDIVLTDR